MALSNSKLYNNMLYDSRPVKFNDFISNKYNIVHHKLYTNALNKYIEEWVKVKEYKKYIAYYEDLINNIVQPNALTDNILSDEEQEAINKYEEKINKYRPFVYAHGHDKNYTEGKYIFAAKTVKEFKEWTSIQQIYNDEYWKPCACRIITKFRNRMSPNLKWTVDLTPYWNFYQKKEEKNVNEIKFENEIVGDMELLSINYVNGTAKLYSNILDREFVVDFDYLDGNNIKFADEFYKPNIYV